ncbi:hypothetical protein BKA69DRAFT_1129712 [Paraphysoderma sedebokerense]|nr:hypothetical protein BKA69DRAFT_1129712 [Paraphysoderma sedebokerense]
MAELLQRPIKYGYLFDMSEASAPVLADNIASAVKAQLDFIRDNKHFACAYRLELSPPNPDLPNQWRVLDKKYCRDPRPPHKRRAAHLIYKLQPSLRLMTIQYAANCMFHIYAVRKLNNQMAPNRLAGCTLWKSCFYSLKKPRYMMAARRELVRELLVIPTDHLTNEDIVTDVGVWEFVIKAMHTELKVEGSLPIEKIAINFGEWETAQAMNKHSQGCHGHIHLQLTKICCSGWPYGGLDYNLENCQVLKSTWLLSSFASVSFRKLGKLEDDVRILKEDVHGLKEDMRDVKRLLQPENFVSMLKEALQSLDIAG